MESLLVIFLIQCQIIKFNVLKGEIDGLYMVIGIIFLLPVMAVSQLRSGAQQIVRTVRGIFLRILAQVPGNIIYVPFFFVVPGMVQHPFINLMRGNVPLLCSSLIPVSHEITGQ